MRRQVYKSISRSGFTLIELSIILVIIGLVVGGILTGQDLMDTAAQRAQISQITKYNTAVNTFRNKYGGLPGDLALNLATQFGFTVNDCAGTVGVRDGNGFIDGYWNPQYILQLGETTMFWQDLSAASLIDSTFPNSGAVTDGCDGVNLSLTPGANYVGDFFPVAKIGNGTFIYVYDGSHANDSCCGGDNWYGISAITSVVSDGGMYSYPAITVLQAYNIDKKIDDGLPTSGQVQPTFLQSTVWTGHPPVYYANPQASDSATSCYNTTTKTYSISVNGGNGQNCALSFKLE